MSANPGRVPRVMAVGRPRYYCPRCKVNRAFRTWLNMARWELRCTVCRWLREWKPVEGGI